MLNFDWLVEYQSLLWRGLGITISLLLLAGIFGFALAVVVALARISSNRAVAGAAFAFTQFIRGTPLLVQIFVLYYGLGSIFADYPWIRESFLWPYLRDGFWYVVVALIVSEGAYGGELIRTGLLGVPRGEIEAARALGMSRGLVLRRIWLPRCIQILLPSLTGEAVLLLKSTALASTVAVSDLLGSANFVRSQTLINYEPLLTVAVAYMVLAWLIERAAGRLRSRAAAAPVR